MRAPNYLFPVGHLIANFRKSIARLPLAWTDDGRVVCPAIYPWINPAPSLTFMTTQTDSAVVFKKPQSFANWEGYTTTIVLLEKSAIEKAKWGWLNENPIFDPYYHNPESYCCFSEFMAYNISHFLWPYSPEIHAEKLFQRSQGAFRGVNHGSDVIYVLRFWGGKVPKDGVFVAISPSRISDKSWGKKSAGSAHLQKSCGKFIFSHFMDQKILKK